MVDLVPCAYLASLKDAIFDNLTRASNSGSPEDELYSVRVFAASDYALLSLWNGISGACGVHPCLWCHETEAGIKISKAGRPTCQKRSLATLAADYERFQEEWCGNIKKAMQFNNVIAKAMFDIPLDQVFVPGLHISLGLYQKFFTMLEGDLHDLDLILANHLASHILHNEDYDPAEVLMDPHLHDLTRYVEAVEQARGPMKLRQLNSRKK
ncbi:hypothetical protein Bbelb_035540 [Branchiostoma belcheri]|nr:hypothetical protein Bbelb_035540 [Branchiostoma belcheri]